MGDRHRQRGAGPGGLGDSRAFGAEQQQAVPRQGGLLQSHRARDVVDGDDGQSGAVGDRQQFFGGVVVGQMLVAVGDHGSAAVPAPPADDVDRVHCEGVGGADHRADIGIVAEVLDRHMKRMTAAVDVGDDLLTAPIPVRVNDVARVAVLQQVLVVARVLSRRLPGMGVGPWADAGRPGRPLGGTGLRPVGRHEGEGSHR